METHLRGKVALVTGASEGLGRHFARTLAEAGATVALGARRTEKLATAVREISAAGGKALAVALDVTDETSVVAAFDEIERRAGTVDVAINNAGISAAKTLLDLSAVEWDGVLATNLKGPWLITREVARRLIARELPGTIVNIASILGERVAGNVSAYAASKGGPHSIHEGRGAGTRALSHSRQCARARLRPLEPQR